MYEKAKTFMEDHFKAFGIKPFPLIVEMPGEGVSFQDGADGPFIAVGRETDIEKLPVAEWMVASGGALLHQVGSDIAPLSIGHESESSDDFARAADDLYFIADLAAIYQCYLQNPVEAFCIYDDAIELGDETSLHPIAVALGLTHPRGLEAMGFDKKKHPEVFEEADFFRPLITQKRPDLSLLVSLQNAWQKQRNVNVRISVENGILRFSKREA